MTTARGDWFGKILGVTVFALGIGIIVVVLWLAYRMFLDPTLGMNPVVSQTTISTPVVESSPASETNKPKVDVKKAPVSKPTPKTAETKGEAATTNFMEIGMGFARLIIRILLLALGSICGSLIANKGIHLYFSSLQARPVVGSGKAPKPGAPAPESNEPNVAVLAPDPAKRL